MSTASSWQGLLRDLQFLLSPSPLFRQQQFLTHKKLSIFGMVLFALQVPTVWIWDHVTDPVGARNTILLRLSSLGILALAWVFSVARVDHIRALLLLSFGFVLVAQMVLMEVFERLVGGMTYGIGGFMYFMMVGLVCFQCFTLKANLLFTLAVSAFPHLLAQLGLAHGFQHANYAALIWPAAVSTMLCQAGMAFNYLRRFESDQQLEFASTTDAMTGARNRRFFMPMMAHEVVRAKRAGQPLALLMLDIDHFKRVNDLYGHPTGDRVIVSLAEVCRQEVRTIDVVARLGGEEFAVLMPNTDVQQARVVAERIRGTVEALVTQVSGTANLRFTVSIGVAALKAADGGGELMARTDALLYEAKASGRNCVRVQAHTLPAPL